MTSVDTERAEPALDDENGYRARLIAGMSKAIIQSGLRDTTIADIVSNARTSRRTFYEHFSSKEECYIALIRGESDRIAASIVGAVDPHAHWQVQVAQAVESWVIAQARQPELMLSWIRDASILGPTARQLERQNMNALVLLVQNLVDTDELRALGFKRPSDDLALILLGGLNALFVATIEDGRDPRTIIPVAIEVTTALLTLHLDPAALTSQK